MSDDYYLKCEKCGDDSCPDGYISMKGSYGGHVAIVEIFKFLFLHIGSCGNEHLKVIKSGEESNEGDIYWTLEDRLDYLEKTKDQFPYSADWSLLGRVEETVRNEIWIEEEKKEVKKAIDDFRGPAIVIG